MKENNSTIEIEMKTKGFEESAEEIEMMADALNSLPSSINLKAKDCEINIHNTNWIEQKQAEPKYAKGGFADKSPGLIMIPTDEPQEEFVKKILRDVKAMCARQGGSCSGCFLHSEKDCIVSSKGVFPETWPIK